MVSIERERDSVSPAGSVRVGSDCHRQSFTTDPFESLSDIKIRRYEDEILVQKTDMATTANIYSHIDSTSKKETAQAIGELLGCGEG